MSNNAGAKKQLIQQFGKICMIEEAGIRKIPISVRRKIKGYKKTEEMLTFHHIVPKSKGGKATPENGALLKDYNHRWLESLPPEDRAIVNEKLREFKVNFATLKTSSKSMQIVDSGTIPLEFCSEKSEEIIIPVFDMDEGDRKRMLKHKSRAKLKREFQEQIDEALYYEENDDLNR